MFRYWGHHTDASGDPVTLDVHLGAHAHVEDHIRRLKDSGADRFPLTDIDADRASCSDAPGPLVGNGRR